MNNIKEYEIKLYDLLGVGLFRNGFNALRNKIGGLFLNKEDKDSILDETSSNSNIGVVKDTSDVKSLKKSYLFNSVIHLGCILVCLPKVITALSTGLFTIPSLVINSGFTILNLYCLLNQRYDSIKLDEVVKIKNIIKDNNNIAISIDEDESYSKEKENSKDEIEFKVVNKKGKEKSTTIDKFLDNASYEELITLRKYLTSEAVLDRLNGEDKNTKVCVPLKKDKILKLSYKK